MSGGRPTTYSQELADALCAEIADGKSMRQICLAEAMPTMKTVFNWLRAYPEFLQQYARAKEETAEAMAEDMLEIADNLEEDPASRRVRIDTRKWIASKLKPKKYGEKVATELSGPGGGPVQVTHGRIVLVKAGEIG